MSVSVGTNEQRIETFYLSNKQKQGLKYLNSKRIKTHRRPCCADLCMRMDLPLDKKLWKIRTGPPDHRAAGPPGRRAVGRGPWAVGLLLAKPDPGANIYVQSLLKFLTLGVHERSKSPSYLVVPHLGRNIDSCIIHQEATVKMEMKCCGLQVSSALRRLWR